MDSTSVKNSIIYYFSGTGNAQSVARWIREFAEQKNIPTKLVNIAELEKRKAGNIPESTLIGICGPTHGFNFPPILLRFIRRFPKSKNNRIFLLNTRAGMKMGKIFLPGLSGIALWLSALILKCKGYKIVGLGSIDLPSNWISVHPGLKEKVVRSIFEKRKKDTEKFIQKIFNGKKNLRTFRDIIQDTLIAPVAIGYYIIGRFIFAKSFIASKSCTHCNLCIEKCPVQAIKIVDDRCFWTYKCESCMQCMNACPQQAIETAHGFIFGFSFLFYAVILAGLYKLSNIDILIKTKLPPTVSEIALFAIEWGAYLFLLFAFYRIIHYLMRFRIFEKLVVQTSLTTYKFWRRYNLFKIFKNDPL